jgi:hypothetical protein
VGADWRTDYILWIEVFALVNLAFLSGDIYLAHSGNDFRYREEWIPFYFSLCAPVALGIGLLAREKWRRPGVWALLGYIVGGVAILVGCAGVIYHLDSQFFYERTILSLTYAAPFVAPLSYTGLGLLLLLNRMVPAEKVEWPLWLLFLVLAGFFGNFVLSLTDHAENGFIHWSEWIPVASSAFAVSFLLMPFFRRVNATYLKVCAAVLIAEAGVGVLGFLLHAMADMYGPSKNLFQNVVSGAPPLAPLLFPNLAVPGLVALWVYGNRLSGGGAPD